MHLRNDLGQGTHPARSAWANLPVSFMYSFVKASVRSVKGSRVESVRVAKAIVNMLLQGSIFVRLMHSRKEGILGYVLQGITTDGVHWVDRHGAHPCFEIHGSD
jgi:hypothetical protein